MKSSIVVKVIILLTIIIVGGCSIFKSSDSNHVYNYEDYNEYTYNYKETSFSFRYPENWVVEESPVWEGSENREAAPDWGVNVYIKGQQEENIYVYGAFTPSTIIYDPSFTKEDFRVDNKERGLAFTKKSSGLVTIYIIYKGTDDSQGSSYNAIVNVSETFYIKYNNIIWSVLASVELD